jgi:hypothetical protein
LRAGNVALAGVEHGLHGGIAARQRVADHHFIGAGRHAVGAVALVQGDAQLFELGRHRRIDGLVAAADRMAEFPRQAATPPMKVPAIARICTLLMTEDCDR